MTVKYNLDGVDLDTLYIRKENFLDRNLFGCGYNNYGQLGDNSVTYKSSPVQTLAGGTNWKQVACGSSNTAAIKTDGTLWGWGYNIYGGIGDNTRTHRSSPVQTIAGGTNWKQVACGDAHSAAIKTDGTLWTWGYNNKGQLGDNTIAHRSSPVQTIAGGTTWKSVSCGSGYIAAIKTDGTLWGWGDNSYGQLGDNSTTDRSSPVQTVAGGTNWKQVDCGSGHTAAIKTDGTLWTWGWNSDGQLGDNSTTDRSSPVQTIAGGTNWKQISCGYLHTAAIKTDGTLWTWGRNEGGQLGDNSVTGRSSPVQTITGSTDWKQVACGYYHTAALKIDGTLWTWGSNTYGALGDNSINDKSSPVQTVAGGTNWKQVACGYRHTIAAKSYNDL